MTLKTTMADDVAIFLNEDEFADSVTYTSHETGATSTVKAIIAVTADLSTTPQGKGITGTATISAADIARPAVYDILTTASGQIWRVEAVTGGDGYVWDLFVTSDNRAVA